MNVVPTKIVIQSLVMKSPKMRMGLPTFAAQLSGDQAAGPLEIITGKLCARSC
jgi:hypothetical protein